MKESLNEERLEKLYWEFDSRKTKEGERNVFKYLMRLFAKESLRRYGVDGESN